MTNEELKDEIDIVITNETSPESITPTDVGDTLKLIVDYVDQESENVGLPYKSYVALITHGAGNGNPTAQVLYNTLGGNVTWLYDEPNNYTASSSALFTLNKTIVFVSSPTNPLMKVGAVSTNVNFVGLTTENDGFANVVIEIRVYP